MNQRVLIAGARSPLLDELVWLYLDRGDSVLAADFPGEGSSSPADPQPVEKAVPPAPMPAVPLERPPAQPAKSAPSPEKAGREKPAASAVVDGTGAKTGDGQVKDKEKEEPKLPFHIDWNRRSPLSSRTVLLECRRLMGGIDRAIVLHSPDRANHAFHEASAGYIESVVDQAVKGYLFLLREIVGYFQEKGGGSLGLVMHDEGSEVLSPVGACVTGSFRALAQSLFMFYQNEPVSILGFSSSSTQVAEYSQFICRGMEEKPSRMNGQWLKYSDRSGFLQSLPLGMRKK